jgi:hypothetical protein
MILDDGLPANLLLHMVQGPCPPHQLVMRMPRLPWSAAPALLSRMRMRQRQTSDSGTVTR